MGLVWVELGALVIHLGNHHGICTECGKNVAHLVKAPQQWPTHVLEWNHTRSPGENIQALKEQHNTLHTAFGDRISQNTHR